MTRLEIGLFLPIANNGFVFSRHSPPYPPSYANNLEIALKAEALGMDYVFSMAKWRGQGGEIRMWDSSFESFSLMMALAAATKRIRLIATVNPLLFHPALMAKMAATFDDVSGGRLGLNIITGALMGEYTQMGVLPDGYDDDRYAYAAEWVQVLKRLWSEPSVTHHGRYFQLEDCVSEPKPLQRPHPRLVCAASSDEGLRFTVREADWCFVSARTVEGVKEKVDRARSIAAEEGRPIKVALLTTLVLGDDDQDAAARTEYLIEGADAEAIANSGMALTAQTRVQAVNRGAERLSDPRKVFFGLTITGGPPTVAGQLAALAGYGVDSLALIFPDYADGLARFSGLATLLGDAIEARPLMASR